MASYQTKVVTLTSFGQIANTLSTMPNPSAGRDWFVVKRDGDQYEVVVRTS